MRSSEAYKTTLKTSFAAFPIQSRLGLSSVLLMLTAN
jgi:hypothetical protein